MELQSLLFASLLATIVITIGIFFLYSSPKRQLLKTIKQYPSLSNIIKLMDTSHFIHNVGYKPIIICTWFTIQKEHDFDWMELHHSSYLTNYVTFGRKSEHDPDKTINLSSTETQLLLSYANLLRMENRQKYQENERQHLQRCKLPKTLSYNPQL